MDNMDFKDDDFRKEEAKREVYNYDDSKKGKGKKGPIIAIVVVAIIFAALIITVTFFSNQEDRKAKKMPTGKYIAEIHVDGVIEPESTANIFDTFQTYKHNFTMDLMNDLIEDDYNKGIIIIIDSPGGAIYETDEVYEKLLEYKKETGRPVHAYFKSLAASGGYFMACAADKIYSNRNTLTGSIGVTMGEVYDVTGLMERYGIKSHAIVSGKNKAMGSPTQPFTEEQQQIYQSLINDSYERFVEVVSKGRKLPKEKVREIADGRIYTARQALKHKLIDGIDTYENAKWKILNDVKEESTSDITFEEFLPEVEENFLSGILNGAAKLPKGDVATLLELAENNSIPISYTNEFLLHRYNKYR